MFAWKPGHLLPSSFPECGFGDAPPIQRIAFSTFVSYTPTDAHKGLPYSMTILHATHAVYSRVAPCGRPSVLNSTTFFLFEEFRPLRMLLFDTALQFLTIFALFVLCIMFVILIVNLCTFPRLRPQASLQASNQYTMVPLVSVLIPARDEELAIERCVRSLVAQTYERLEILVLDDHSSDATATLVQRIIDGLPQHQQGRLQLLQGTALPSEWGGKNFACHQLTQYATGDYLFFTDADTTHDPKMVTSVLAMMQTQKVSLLTVQPTYELDSLGEQLVVPLLTFTILTLLPVALIPTRPEPSLATGNGQLLCFEQTVYERIGGHEIVKNRILEDVLLARTVKAAGFRMLFVDAQDIVYCRMYRSFSAVWSGFSKNLFAFYNYSLPFALGALLLNILLFVAPVVFMISAPLLHLSDTVRLLATIAYLLPVLMRILLTLRFTHVQRIEMLLLCFLHPISIALECLILLNSIRWHYRKRGTVWKGREYVTSR